MAPYIQLPISDEKPRRRLLTPARAGIALLITIVIALFALSCHKTHPPHVHMAPAGWHSRATPHPDGSAYDIKKENVVFGLTRNSRVEPEGFSVALFKPNVAVDAMGRVVVLNKDDWSALANLASQTNSLPDTGSFRNQWRVKHDRTDYPIDYLHVSTGSGLHTIGVYGHDGQTTALKPPVGDITDLPEPLNKLVTYAKEGRDGFERGQENAEVTARVKAVLQE